MCETRHDLIPLKALSPTCVFLASSSRRPPASSSMSSNDEMLNDSVCEVGMNTELTIGTVRITLQFNRREESR